MSELHPRTGVLPLVNEENKNMVARNCWASSFFWDQSEKAQRITERWKELGHTFNLDRDPQLYLDTNEGHDPAMTCGTWANRGVRTVCWKVVDTTMPRAKDHYWQPLDGKRDWSLHGAYSLVPKPSRDSWAGNWRVPDKTWDPKTWIRISHLMTLPDEFLRTKVWYQRPDFGRDYLRPYLGAKELHTLPGMNGLDLVARCPENTSFMLSVGGWPLKYVSRRYLRWLVGDGKAVFESDYVAEGFALIRDSWLVKRPKPEDYQKWVYPGLHPHPVVQSIHMKTYGDFKKAVLTYLAEFPEEDQLLEIDPDNEFSEFFGSGEWSTALVYDERGQCFNKFLSTGACNWHRNVMLGRPVWIETGFRGFDDDPPSPGTSLGLQETPWGTLKARTQWVAPQKEEGNPDWSPLPIPGDNSDAWKWGLVIQTGLTRTREAITRLREKLGGPVREKDRLLLEAEVRALEDHHTYLTEYAWGSLYAYLQDTDLWPEIENLFSLEPESFEFGLEERAVLLDENLEHMTGRFALNRYRYEGARPALFCDPDVEAVVQVVKGEVTRAVARIQRWKAKQEYRKNKHLDWVQEHKPCSDDVQRDYVRAQLEEREPIFVECLRVASNQRSGSYTGAVWDGRSRS